MRLLVVTQAVDVNDPILGFFHEWLRLLAEHTERLMVICLRAGEYHLPSNVTILSLGKEKKVSRYRYIWQFYRYIFNNRKQYDAVFVHMNPEYAILGGPLWRLWGKKVLLWYTHKAVNLRLRFAEKFVNKVFTASKESFRLPSTKVEIVGHGIPVDAFHPRGELKAGETMQLLSVGRLSPVKDLETVIQAFHKLHEQNPSWQMKFTIIGEPITDVDREYALALRELVGGVALSDRVEFAGAKTYEQMRYIYAHSHALLHTSKTGSIDKVVLEAMAAGLTVFTTSEAYGGFLEFLTRVPGDNAEALAEAIEKGLPRIHRCNYEAIAFVREHHSLDRLIHCIVQFFSL